MMEQKNTIEIKGSTRQSNIGFHLVFLVLRGVVLVQ